MREIFPGFYDFTDDEISKFWQEGIFVFDTNMLLNVYRYSEEARDRLFEILEKLKDRIWIPYQVALEYHNDRVEVIEGQIKAYSEVSQAIKNASGALNSIDFLKGRHSFIDVDALTKASKKSLSEANEKLSQEQTKYKKEFEKLKGNDDRRDRIVKLFENRIGDPYRRSKMLEVYQNADVRFNLQIPPGWKDKAKKYNKYGDVILWFQLIDHARSQKKPIVFVTSDTKSDWYMSKEESRSRMKPRPELVQEMWVEAHVLIHIYQGHEFLEEAEKFLNLQQKPEVIEEAKELTERNTKEDTPTLNYLAKSGRQLREIEKSLEPEVLKSVTNWVEDNVNYKDIVHYQNDAFPNIVLSGSEGQEIGVKVKIEFNASDVIREIKYLLSNFIKSIEKFASFYLFMVYTNKHNARRAKELLETIQVFTSTSSQAKEYERNLFYTEQSLELYLPRQVYVVVGYYQEDRFIFVKNFSSAVY